MGGLGALVAGLNRGLPGALAGLVVLAIALFAALAPVGGPHELQWLPVAAGFTLQRMLREARYRHPLTDGDQLPGPLAGLRIVAVDVPGQPAGTAIGVVEDRRRGTLTAVAAVAAADPLGLLDPDEADARLTGWGGLLAGARSRRLRGARRRSGWPAPSQTSARTWRGSGPKPARSSAASGTGRSAVSAAAASYRQLLDALTDPSTHLDSVRLLACGAATRTWRSRSTAGPGGPSLVWRAARPGMRLCCARSPPCRLVWLSATSR